MHKAQIAFQYSKRISSVPAVVLQNLLIRTCNTLCLFAVANISFSSSASQSLIYCRQPD